MLNQRILCQFAVYILHKCYTGGIYLHQTFLFCFLFKLLHGISLDHLSLVIFITVCLQAQRLHRKKKKKKSTLQKSNKYSVTISAISFESNQFICTQTALQSRLKVQLCTSTRFIMTGCLPDLIEPQKSVFLLHLGHKLLWNPPSVTATALYCSTNETWFFVHSSLCVYPSPRSYLDLQRFLLLTQCCLFGLWISL